MAVDTRDKRASSLGYGNTVFPNPDGAIGTADRLHTVGLYSGIAASAPVAEAPVDIGEIVLRMRTPPFMIVPEELDPLRLLVEEMFRRVFFDLSSGAIRHTVTDAVPEAADIEEGMAILYDNESDTRRIYLRMNDTIRYVNLT